MALDTTLKGGERIVPYYHWFWNRLTWQEVKVPAPYTEHWVCLHKGKVAGEFFKGKSGMYYGVVYAHHERPHIYTVWRHDWRLVLYIMAATILGPSH
jgi:hypothetical protein